MKQSLSVEIFRDTEAREIGTDTAEHGIDIIRRQSVGLEIVRHTRLLRLAIDDDESIDMDTFRWPTLQADLNIVLTNRALIRNGSQDTSATLGYAERSKGIAIVTQKDHAHTTVAHEAGHLLGLKHSGANFDGESHCADPLCLMHEYGAVIKDSERIKKRGIKGWLERRGYTPADYETIEKPRTETFCDECTAQLGHNAFWLLRFHSGEIVPSDIAKIGYRDKR